MRPTLRSCSRKLAAPSWVLRAPRVASLRASGFIHGTLHQYCTRTRIIAAPVGGGYAAATAVCANLSWAMPRIQFGARASEMRRCSAPLERPRIELRRAERCLPRWTTNDSRDRCCTPVWSSATTLPRLGWTTQSTRVSIPRSSSEGTQSRRTRVDRAARRVHEPSASSGFRRRGLPPVTASGGKSKRAHGGSASPPSSSHS